jgi:mannose-6-phosphate isomerase-like protein (cupin superfamily)
MEPESDNYPGVIAGAGYAIGRLEDLGDGPGFRKVRRALGVTAFGVNAVVIPAGIESGFHAHEIQEELYFVHRGELEIEFGDGSCERLPAGSFARVDAPTMRRLRNAGAEDAVYVCVGANAGYVGRDAYVPEGDPGPRAGPITAPDAGD